MRYKTWINQCVQIKSRYVLNARIKIEKSTTHKITEVKRLLKGLSNNAFKVR